MQHVLNIQIAGLGLIIYSPWAVSHIAPDTDYLAAAFCEPEDVARHVMACSIAGVGTGSPGDFRLHFYTGPLDTSAVEKASFKARLGLEVHDNSVCVRDLYDLMCWERECPAEQQFTIADGFYRITAYTSPPPSGIFGDDQDIFFHLHAVPAKPHLVYEGVPQLC